MWWAADSPPPPGTAGDPPDGPRDGGGAARLLALRLLFATFLVGTGLLVLRLAGPGGDAGGLLAALGLIYASVGVAWAALRRGAAPRPLAAWQLVADVGLVALLCRFAGDAGPAFRLLFFVPVLLAAAWLGTRGAVTLAAIAAVVVAAQARDAGPGGPGVLAAHFTAGLLLLAGWVAGSACDRVARRERERAREADELRRARVEVSSVLDNLSSGLLITDRAGVVLALNPAAERILGVLGEEVVGRGLE